MDSCIHYHPLTIGINFSTCFISLLSFCFAWICKYSVRHQLFSLICVIACIFLWRRCLAPVFSTKEFEKTSSLNRSCGTNGSFQYVNVVYVGIKQKRPLLLKFLVITSLKSCFWTYHCGWKHPDHFMHKWQSPEVPENSTYSCLRLSTCMDSATMSLTWKCRRQK